MNKKIDDENSTQQWLNELSDDTKRRFFIVVEILHDEARITTTDYFKYPKKRLLAVNDPDVNSLIKKLNSKRYIKVYQPQGDEELTFVDFPDIILDDFGFNDEILESGEVVVELNPRKFNELYEYLKGIFRPKKKTIIIKNADIDEKNYGIIINKGIFIPFNQKKEEDNEEDEERITKTFKIIRLLWENRQEFKNNKVIRDGKGFSIQSIINNSGCQGFDALRSRIDSINDKFKNYENGVIPIDIKKMGFNFVLRINKN